MLSARILTTAQRCIRRGVLERDFHLRRWPPKTLLEVCMREALLGGNTERSRKEAAARLLETCAKPGLELDGAEPFALAQDLLAILATSLEAISRKNFPKVTLGGLVPLAEGLEWQIGSFCAATRLVRVAVVEDLSADTVARELHSWYVFGDCAAAQLPMSLWLVAIGRRVKGRMASPWCRVFKHPAILGRFSFQHDDGTPLRGDWRAVRFGDSDANSPERWVDLMEHDNVKALDDIQVNVPPPWSVDDFREQAAIEAARIASFDDWTTAPMSRPACDMPTICSWQDVCYARAVVDIETLGPYARNKA